VLTLCHELLKDSSSGAFRQFLAHARERHGDKVDYLPPVFEERQRKKLVSEQRQKLLDPDQRFFLALLLNVSDRAGIRTLVEKRYPTEAWVDVVSRWMFGPQQPDGPAPIAAKWDLGHSQAAQQALRAALAGDVDAKSEALGPFLRSPLLAPLFRAEST
jgi:hypothetical protein